MLGELFSDPNKLSTLGRFLGGLGQGITQGGAQGLSPFAALGVGFGNASQGLRDLQAERQQTQQTELMNQFRQAQLENMQSTQDLNERRFGLQEQEFLTEQARRDQEALAGAQQQQQLETFISSLPPDQQAIARINPNGFIENLTKSLFSETDLTTLQQNLAAAGLQPGSEAYQSAMLEAVLGGPQVVVNTGNTAPEPNPFREAEEGVQVGQYTEALEALPGLYNELDNIKALEASLQNTPQGGLAPMFTSLRNYALSAGIELGDIGEIAAAQASQAQIGDLVTKIFSRFPGQLSDGERRYAETLVPNLSNSPEGNQLILNAMREKVQQEIDRTEAMDRWIGENGSLTGFERYWGEQVNARWDSIIQRQQPVADSSPSGVSVGGQTFGTGDDVRAFLATPEGREWSENITSEERQKVIDFLNEGS